MRSDIIYRIQEVIRHVTHERRRLKTLEEETGIPSDNWKNVWNGKQRPTAHMIESLGRRWPQYAFWIVTGITDEENGHTAPPEAWTCNQLLAKQHVEDAASKYFNLKIFAQDLTYGPSNAAVSNFTVKKNPTENELLLARKESDPQAPCTQEMLDHIFGKEVKVWEKKHAELDQAIAQIAFDRRLRALKSEFEKFGIEDEPARVTIAMKEVSTMRHNAKVI